MKKETFTKAHIKALARLLADNSVNVAKSEYPSEAIEYAEMLNEAKDFIAKFNGKILTERLREGFIGKEVFTNSGEKYYQSSRGAPHGTIVAIAFGGKVYTGVVYSKGNYDIPIIGQYLALKNAIRVMNGNKPNVYMLSKDKDQIKHFEKRALAYFYPDKYSVSRGTEPVVYENYEKIHDIQKRILGKC